MTETLRWHYGPTATDPEPGKMWHDGCGREVMFIEDGHICGCGAQDADDEDAPISSVAEAHAMLTSHALNALWSRSDVQPDDDDLWGCCHVCCAPCAALDYLDRQGVLDEVLSAWPHGVGSDTHKDGKVDREWMRRQWSGSPMQEQCGHRWTP